MAVGPSILLTLVRVSLRIFGSRMSRKNSAAPSRMAMMLIFHRIFFRENFRSPLMNMRQWVQTNRLWIMLYSVTNTTHSGPKMALTKGMVMLPELG